MVSPDYCANGRAGKVINWKGGADETASDVVPGITGGVAAAIVGAATTPVDATVVGVAVQAAATTAAGIWGYEVGKRISGALGAGFEYDIEVCCGDKKQVTYMKNVIKNYTYGDDELYWEP